MKVDSLFIGVSRAAPPDRGVVRLLAPAQEVSSRELPYIEGPKVILGGTPCDHWANVIRERTDTLYVVVGDTPVPNSAKVGATCMPAAPVAQLRRHFTHLIELRQRYPGGLPQIGDTSFQWKGHAVELTDTELGLLRRLFEMQGAIVDREDLARAGGVRTERSRALEAHIHRLRQKLRIPGVDLLTERQRGFRLVLS